MSPFCKVGLTHRNGCSVAWKRCVHLSGNPVADRALNAMTGGRIESWLKKYENLVGLTEVKDAQNKVMQVRNCLLFLWTR